MFWRRESEEAGYRGRGSEAEIYGDGRYYWKNKMFMLNLEQNSIYLPTYKTITSTSVYRLLPMIKRNSFIINLYISMICLTEPLSQSNN